MMCSLIVRVVFDIKVIVHALLELPPKIYEEFKSLLFVLEYIKQKLIQNKVALKLVKKLPDGTKGINVNIKYVKLPSK